MAKNDEKHGLEWLQGRPQSLDRWPGERLKVHRAMLLYVMQAPAKRSKRSVSKAIGVHESTVRDWYKRGAWQARGAADGQTNERAALDMYRHSYMREHGANELPFVAERVHEEFGGETHTGSEAYMRVQDAADARRKAIPKALKIVESAVAGEIAKRRAQERHAADTHLKLVDASLGLIASKLKGKAIKVSLRDIPVLLECRSRLVQVILGVEEHAHGAVIESSRVKHAKAVGGDIVDAMYEDAVELEAILGVLRTRRDVDTQQLATDEDAATSA